MFYAWPGPEVWCGFKRSTERRACSKPLRSKVWADSRRKVLNSFCPWSVCTKTLQPGFHPSGPEVNGPVWSVDQWSSVYYGFIFQAQELFFFKLCRQQTLVSWLIKECLTCRDRSLLYSQQVCPRSSITLSWNSTSKKRKKNEPQNELRFNMWMFYFSKSRH